MLDPVTRLLFEDLPLLVIAEVIALAVVLAIHRRILTRRSRRAVWVTLGVCAALVAMQSLVVTKREALEDVVAQLARAIDEADDRDPGQTTGAIGQRIDREFQHRDRDWKEFVVHLVDVLGVWKIDEASVGDFKIELTRKDEARVSFRATCDARRTSTGQWYRNVVSYWTLYCVHRKDGWKLFRFEKGEAVYLGRTFNVLDDFQDG